MIQDAKIKGYIRTLEFEASNLFKGTEGVSLSKTPFLEWHVPFPTVPESLSDPV